MKRILIGAFCIFAYLIIMPGVGVANANVIQLESVEVGKDPLQDSINENLTRQRLEMEKTEQQMIEEIDSKKIEIAIEERVAERKRYWKEVEDARAAAKNKAQVKSEKQTETKVSSSQNSKSNASFKLSFYSTLPEENGGYSKMANGQSIHSAQMVVASNYYAIGTKIYLEGWGIMTVSDRGGSAFNDSSRLDVLIHQKSGESKSAYKQRISDLGRRTVSGYIVN